MFWFRHIQSTGHAAACNTRLENPQALGRTGPDRGHYLPAQGCFFIQASSCAISLVWSLTILRAIALSSGDFP